jgi:hypothetical protein
MLPGDNVTNTEGIEASFPSPVPKSWHSTLDSLPTLSSLAVNYTPSPSQRRNHTEGKEISKLRRTKGMKGKGQIDSKRKRKRKRKLVFNEKPLKLLKGLVVLMLPKLNLRLINRCKKTELLEGAVGRSNWKAVYASMEAY